MVTRLEPLKLKLADRTMSGKLIVISFSSVEMFQMKMKLSAPGEEKEDTDLLQFARNKTHGGTQHAYANQDSNKIRKE